MDFGDLTPRPTPQDTFFLLRYQRALEARRIMSAMVVLAAQRKRTEEGEDVARMLANGSDTPQPEVVL